MKAASVPRRRPRDGKLMVVDRDGDLRHHGLPDLADLLRPGDLLVANDAATIPASLKGVHLPSGEEIEIRLAARQTLEPSDVRDFLAIVFGAGDSRTRTEDRGAPPPLREGDPLRLGPLTAHVRGPGIGDGSPGELFEHPRLVRLGFSGDPAAVWAAIASHGKPIQYSHVRRPLALWDVWTRVANRAVAFEAPSAGFLLDWRLLQTMRSRGVGFATLTHAAGISSTGDSVLDGRLPFDEAYEIPPSTARAVEQTRERGGRIVALGTSVTRALESGSTGPGLATGRLGPGSELRWVDAIITGTHEPGESHYELLRAFAGADLLARISQSLDSADYLTHEFGDSLFLERQPKVWGSGGARGLFESMVVAASR